MLGTYYTNISIFSNLCDDIIDDILSYCDTVVLYNIRPTAYWKKLEDQMGWLLLKEKVIY